ncbi:hypothetical protein [Roseibium limicola]|uniref:Uncharacterized protein n=1 Tax=Roseibium limicola TaxID=2816037 RepID=A0A939ENH1_9HYPH|nr:hypothetical protein [Roseibium limicola]MBO0345061.1 hypothetical protein [Roseibium limicola]
MFNTYAESILTATRLGQFTRPLPVPQQRLHHVSDAAPENREIRRPRNRFTFWI